MPEFLEFWRNFTKFIGIAKSTNSDNNSASVRLKAGALLMDWFQANQRTHGSIFSSFHTFLCFLESHSSAAREKKTERKRGRTWKGKCQNRRMHACLPRGVLGYVLSESKYAVFGRPDRSSALASRTWRRQSSP